MSDLWQVVGLSLLGGVVGLVGGVIFLGVKSWSKNLAKYAVPFAAGVLLTVSLIGLLPEAVEVIGQPAYLVVFVSFLASYLFEFVFFALHHHDSHSHDHKTKSQASAGLIVAGDTVHNLIDGIAIGAAYLINPGLGLITAISTLLHEVPHEIGDFGVLLKAGWKRKKIILVNLVSALTTVVGAVAVFYLSPSQAPIGYLLAVAAGMFLYLGASDFLPKADEGVGKIKAAAFLLLGSLLMYSTLMLVPHTS